MPDFRAYHVNDLVRWDYENAHPVETEKVTMNDTYGIVLAVYPDYLVVAWETGKEHAFHKDDWAAWHSKLELV